MRDDKIKTPNRSLLTVRAHTRKAGDACAPRNTQTHTHTHTGKLLPLFPTPCAEQTGSVVCARRRLPERNLLPCDIAILALMAIDVGWGHSLSP